MGALDGKVAIVTGAGRGLGRAQALAFAREGARVVVVDRGTAPDGSGTDAGVAQTVADEIGDRAIAYCGDVGRPEQVKAMVQHALERFGRVDVLSHNAGFVNDRPLLELDEERWDASIDGLLKGTFFVVQAVARQMVAQGGGGRVVIASSVAGLLGAAGMPAYAAAKAGIYGFGRAVSMDLKPHGITVNILSPIAYTRLTAPMFAATPGAETALSPDHVADVVTFLVSDAAGDTTGVVVDVQGSQVTPMRMALGTNHRPKQGDRWTLSELKDRWTELMG